MSMDRVTGVTGNPVADGLTRAGWVAAVQGFLAFSVLRWEWVTAPELALLEIPIIFGAVGFWGLFDAVRRRL